MVKLLNCFARRVVATTSCLCRRLRVLHAQSSVQPLWTARQTDLPAVTLREISKWLVGWILDVSSWCEFMSTQMATKQMKSNCYLNPIQLQTESKLTPPCCSFITISTHQSCWRWQVPASGCRPVPHCWMDHFKGYEISRSLHTVTVI